MVGGERAGQHIHQGGLAGAVFADQRVNLAGERFEIDGVEREGTAEAPGYGVGAEHLGKLCTGGCAERLAEMVMVASRTLAQNKAVCRSRDGLLTHCP